MTGRTPMTPADLATALDVYRSTGTWAAAARAVGRDESTVRRALRRDAPTRSTLMREALDDAQWNALRAVNIARRRVVAALQVADDPRDVATLAHAAHDGLRAVTVARAGAAREREAIRGGRYARGGFQQFRHTYCAHARVRGPVTPGTTPACLDVPRRASTFPTPREAASSRTLDGLPRRIGVSVVDASPSMGGQRRGVANDRSYVGHESLTARAVRRYTTVHEAQHEAVW